jgi:hypothetical protein
MPPHGPGMIGGTHSHDPEYPDDDWNLYTQVRISCLAELTFLLFFTQLDPETTTALNCSQPQDALGIFKVFLPLCEIILHPMAAIRFKK